MNRLRITLQVTKECSSAGEDLYDCSHDYAHIDRYNLRGKQRKEQLHLSFAEALTLADEDIDLNWELYKEKFLKGGYP